ncbi:ComF family protein [Novosphingobium sp. KN65.2]|uniref:ComF family protein n=1 Tax=Novosphingobium sp. KN65.2 TaxID=1478134 RepID=UPI0005E73B98|nr:ComF family protein [Novosphingobium sp. KN65.2]CDO38782.1 Amidophosphoribosyltransferase [Novosphingobium sp. KN65.2]
MPLSQALAPLVDLVFPPRCPLCGEGIAAQTGLCSTCWSQLAIPGDPSCAACSRPFAEGTGEGTICAPCLASPPRHDGIAAATLYNDVSRKLVLSLKHGNRISLAPMMAGLMRAKLPFVDETWVVVPVPLHRWRIWKRGYNQSAELAREICKVTLARHCVDLLERRKATPSLGGLGRKARKRMLSGAIDLNPRRVPQAQGAKIVLVDDVMTSGATSDACVAALKRAGAETVVIACFSRVLDEALDLT